MGLQGFAAVLKLPDTRLLMGHLTQEHKTSAVAAATTVQEDTRQPAQREAGVHLPSRVSSPRDVAWRQIDPATPVTCRRCL